MTSEIWEKNNKYPLSILDIVQINVMKNWQIQIQEEWANIADQ